MLKRNMKHTAGVCALAALLYFFGEYAYSQERGGAAAGGDDARRATFTIAFTAYYANWSPVWKKYRKIFPVYTEGSYTLPKGTFLYGPSVSVKIGRWQISGNFLYGDFRGDLLSYRFTTVFNAGIPPIPYRTTMKVKKYDCDLLVSYQINRLFKFFFGPKYQGYQYKKRNIEYFSYTTPGEDVQYHSGGLGAGIGCSLPITADLYLMMNFSGIVLVGSQKGSYDQGDRTSVAYGGNEIVTLAYHIKAIHTVISVGGRLQYLYFHITPHRYCPEKHDIFYGINMSAGVSF